MVFRSDIFFLPLTEVHKLYYASIQFADSARRYYPDLFSRLVRRICGCRRFPGNMGGMAIVLVSPTVSTDSRFS